MDVTAIARQLNAVLVAQLRSRAITRSQAQEVRRRFLGWALLTPVTTLRLVPSLWRESLDSLRDFNAAVDLWEGLVARKRSTRASQLAEGQFRVASTKDWLDSSLGAMFRATGARAALAPSGWPRSLPNALTLLSTPLPSLLLDADEGGCKVPISVKIDDKYRRRVFASEDRLSVDPTVPSKDKILVVGLNSLATLRSIQPAIAHYKKVEGRAFPGEDIVFQSTVLFQIEDEKKFHLASKLEPQVGPSGHQLFRSFKKRWNQDEGYDVERRAQIVSVSSSPARGQVVVTVRGMTPSNPEKLPADCSIELWLPAGADNNQNDELCAACPTRLVVPKSALSMNRPQGDDQVVNYVTQPWPDGKHRIFSYMRRMLVFQVLDQYEDPLHPSYRTLRKPHRGLQLKVGFERVERQGGKSNVGVYEDLLRLQEEVGGAFLMDYNYASYNRLPQIATVQRRRVRNPPTAWLAGATFVDINGRFNDGVTLFFGVDTKNLTPLQARNWVAGRTGDVSLFHKYLADKSIEARLPRKLLFSWSLWGHELEGKVERSLEVPSAEPGRLVAKLVVRDVWKDQ